MIKQHYAALVLAFGLLSGCATQLASDANTGAVSLKMQNRLLSPVNGGRMVVVSDLQPGDIVLSSAMAATSLGIRTLTMSPVSHAALYTGNAEIAEAVGSGVRQRSVQSFIDEEATIVAFRHPAMTPDRARQMQAFVQRNLGQKYNYIGVVLQAPFTLERRFCELPLVPSLVRDFCVRGVAAIQLGAVKNDQFFCSQLVLEAYRSAGLPLTDADPRMISPDDLLHMREGDVPSVQIHHALSYVGHLKSWPATQVAAAEPEQSN
jgi:uncharacterized protein YycO